MAVALLDGNQAETVSALLDRAVEAVVAPAAIPPAAVVPTKLLPVNRARRDANARVVLAIEAVRAFSAFAGAAVVAALLPLARRHAALMVDALDPVGAGPTRLPAIAVVGTAVPAFLARRKTGAVSRAGSAALEVLAVLVSACDGAVSVAVTQLHFGQAAHSVSTRAAVGRAAFWGFVSFALAVAARLDAICGARFHLGSRLSADAVPADAAVYRAHVPSLAWAALSVSARGVAIHGHAPSQVRVEQILIAANAVKAAAAVRGAEAVQHGGCFTRVTLPVPASYPAVKGTEEHRLELRHGTDSVSAPAAVLRTDDGIFCRNALLTEGISADGALAAIARARDTPLAVSRIASAVAAHGHGQVARQVRLRFRKCQIHSAFIHIPCITGINCRGVSEAVADRVVPVVIAASPTGRCSTSPAPRSSPQRYGCRADPWK